MLTCSLHSGHHDIYMDQPSGSPSQQSSSEEQAMKITRATGKADAATVKHIEDNAPPFDTCTIGIANFT